MERGNLSFRSALLLARTEGKIASSFLLAMTTPKHQ